MHQSSVVKGFAKKQESSTNKKDRSLHITAVCWSDDADPSTGSKENQNNIWVFTLTLGRNNVK
eukprot:2294892-Ditylum_brightwellii.AAC.1